MTQVVPATGVPPERLAMEILFPFSHILASAVRVTALVTALVLPACITPRVTRVERQELGPASGAKVKMKLSGLAVVPSNSSWKPPEIGPRKVAPELEPPIRASAVRTIGPVSVQLKMRSAPSPGEPAGAVSPEKPLPAMLNDWL